MIQIHAQIELERVERQSESPRMRDKTPYSKVTIKEIARDSVELIGRN